MSSAPADLDPVGLPIGERIRHFRLAAGLTQEELAERINCPSRLHIITWEKGRHRPSIQYRIRLAEVLGVTIDQLVHDGPGGGGAWGQIRGVRSNGTADSRNASS